MNYARVQQWNKGNASPLQNVCKTNQCATAPVT